jgi:hypothetical protein
MRIAGQHHEVFSPARGLTELSDPADRQALRDMLKNSHAVNWHLF